MTHGLPFDRYKIVCRAHRHVRIGVWFALALLVVTQPAGATGSYPPRVETAVETCGKAALALHPGKVARTDVLYGEKSVRIEVHIKQRDGKEWIVLCDGTSGKILSTIDVDAP
jgi:hypothetical protein